MFTAAIEQATDLALWQELIMFGLLLGLLAAFVMGVLAVFRRHERSWVVVVPTALIGVVIVNELVQGILGLFGLGGE